jgi:hypothetical protein
MFGIQCSVANLLFSFNSKDNICLLLISIQCPSRSSGQVRRSCDAEKLKPALDGGGTGSKKCKRVYGGV